jgi:hypothetical protein
VTGAREHRPHASPTSGQSTTLAFCPFERLRPVYDRIRGGAMKTKSQVVTFRTTPAVARQIKAAARRAGQSVSAFVEAVVACALRWPFKGEPESHQDPAK